MAKHNEWSGSPWALAPDDFWVDDVTGQLVRASDGARLPEGFTLEIDTDGDWVLCPPDDVTIFSAPGEGYLIGLCDAATAFSDALDYLASY
jgi:hypothetical protein